jgi:hypothetical protein
VLAPPRLRRKRAEPRLDPVRWRRPSRGMLIRLIAVAVLLTVGAAAAWSRPPACALPTALAASPSGRAVPQAEGAAQPTREAAVGSPSSPGAAPPGAALTWETGAADGRAATGDVTQRSAGTAGGRSGHPVPPGRVGVPVRLAEPTALALLHPGDRVDLLRVDGAGHGTTAVATGAPVLDITGAGDPTMGGLLLALRPTEAERAVVSAGHGFAVLIRP